MKVIINLFFILFSFTSQSYEINRDPILENYISSFDISEDNLENIFLVVSDTPNAFVIEKSIYFTTELIKLIKDEDALKAIFYHELGHVINNHYDSKKIKINNNKSSKLIGTLFSISIAAISGNPTIGIASNLAIDKSMVNNLSTHSIRYEIQADDYMIKRVKENELNTYGLINFFEHLPDQKNIYFQSHPKPSDRINVLKKYSKKDKLSKNSKTFEWIKAKYSQNSNIDEFNVFFEKLEEGTNDKEKLSDLIPSSFVHYELYKKGLVYEDIDKIFTDLIDTNSNTYLKIEFFNFIIDSDINTYFNLIEKSKHHSDFQKEYFYYFIIGKYYNKINEFDLSNFYFCQFYQLIKLVKKSDFFCSNYDMSNISQLDKSYGIFK